MCKKKKTDTTTQTGIFDIKGVQVSWLVSAEDLIYALPQKI